MRVARTRISDAAQTDFAVTSAATTGRCTFDARLHQHHPRTCVGRIGGGVSADRADVGEQRIPERPC